MNGRDLNDPGSGHNSRSVCSSNFFTQRSLIQNLASEKEVRISQEEMDGLSKKQASTLTDRSLGASPQVLFVFSHAALPMEAFYEGQA